MSVIGLGTTFWRDAGGTPAQVAQVVEIGEVAATADTIETTTYESTDRYRTYIQGLKDGGEFSITLLFDSQDAGQTALIADYESGDLVEYELQLPTTDNDTIEFEAIVTNIGQAIPMEDRITRSVSFKLSGGITFGTWTGGGP